MSQNDKHTKEIPLSGNNPKPQGERPTTAPQPQPKPSSTKDNK